MTNNNPPSQTNSVDEIISDVDDDTDREEIKRIPDTQETILTTLSQQGGNDKISINMPSSDSEEDMCLSENELPIENNRNTLSIPLFTEPNDDFNLYAYTTDE